MQRIKMYWRRLTALGTAGIADGRVLRDVQITNRIALYVLIACAIYLGAIEIVDPGLRHVYWVGPLLAVSLLTLCLNAAGRTNASRTFLCLAFPYYLLIVTAWIKTGVTDEPMRYLTPRIAMLAGGLFPVLLFGTNGRRPWILMLAGTMTCLLIYNPLHNFLGIGYYQMGFTEPGYYTLDILFVIVYMMIVLSAFALKKNMELSEGEILEAHNVLNAHNSELTEANNQIKAQNHEIMTQNEEIMAQNEHITAQEKTLRATFERLTKANETIENQKHTLLAQNDRLAKLLSDTDQNLLNANEELMKQNNELQQFSYTVSHHLRGPVARLLGLTNLFRLNQDPKMIIEHITRSASDLDETLHDLTRIIDIRNEVYSVRERVTFSEQFESVKKVLSDQLPEVNRIHADFSEAPALISIPPVIFSVMYQLVSNAIMFKSPERELKVSLRTFWDADEIVMEVKDNGLGLDVALYKDDLFKMYRTFHAHKAGRGLGLYLVRTQLSIIGARIDVKSQINEGTTFCIYFTPSDSTSAQLCYGSDHSTVKYLAPFEAFELKFIGEPSSDEFRKTISRCCDLMKQYKATNFISDLREVASISQADQEWGAHKILKAMMESGIRKLFHVLPLGQSPVSPETENVITDSGIELIHVSSPEEAIRSLEVFVPVR